MKNTIVIILNLFLLTSNIYAQNNSRTAGKTITQFLDIRYARIPNVKAKYHSLDVYSPINGKKLPVIVMIHGGGWQHGDKSNDFVGKNLAEFYCHEGFVFVSINYRLVPEGKYPSNIKDVAKAVAWVHNHIDKYGGNPSQINLMGHSAGAHLAALLSTDERMLAEEGKPLSILKHTILLDAPAYDIPRYIKECTVNKKTEEMATLYKTFGTTEALWRDASPQYHIAPDKNIPPILAFYTRNLMDSYKCAPAFAKSLRDAGVPACAIYTDMLHTEILMKAGEKGHPITQFILRFLKGEDPTHFPKYLNIDKSVTSQ